MIWGRQSLCQAGKALRAFAIISPWTPDERPLNPVETITPLMFEVIQ